jgi:hypothetical protein
MRQKEELLVSSYKLLVQLTYTIITSLYGVQYQVSQLGIEQIVKPLSCNSNSVLLPVGLAIPESQLRITHAMGNMTSFAIEIFATFVAIFFGSV